jgi:hypothetical protein
MLTLTPAVLAAIVGRNAIRDWRRERREARLTQVEAAVRTERAILAAEAADGHATLNAARADLERSAQMRGLRR